MSKWISHSGLRTCQDLDRVEKLRAKLDLSFSAKVLVPVVAIMVLLLAITVCLVNQRLTQQFQAEAARSLARADGEFQNAQKRRARNLVERFRNLRKEPRYKAILQSGDLPTMLDAIKDLPDEQGVDVALFHSLSGGALARVKRDSLILLSISEFETNSAAAVNRAREGEETVDTIRVGERLFDVVSIPVSDGNGVLLGALTFGSEIRNADVQEFSLLTFSQIVLLADGRVIASTVPNPEPQQDFARLFRECATPPRGGRGPAPMQKVLLGQEHYFCAGGRFATLARGGGLGYLLLSSYEQPLHALHSTQEMLLVVSALGILLGTAIVWFLVRTVTQPLRALSASAEAVGQGDFSQRVAVTTRDECGELAAVFNQMTENLKRSREQLQTTVETLKTTQSQLIQSEKLSGIGEFVAGVAHELNNPLTSVIGFSELLKRSDQDPQHQRHLELIFKSALRCQKIVQNLLSFARRHKPERKLASVNTLVEGAVEFLQYQMRTSNIEVALQLDPHLPQAMVDPHQVQQVFLNIINNARQAIESHQPSGCVRISTETCGCNVRVVLQDDGPGIPDENLSKVFDPFFTTKEAGKGTGLGLSLCYGIIKDHGGSIVVRSNFGEGATFVIELPLAHDAVASSPAQENPSAQPWNRTEGAGKKVLVIDDEEAILQMMRETLAQQGYEVDTARDGESALRSLNQKPYDLALCDWKMPGLNGEQVYERIRMTNPALSERMIFITGDVINDKAQQFLQQRKKICLSKPFSLGEFRRAIGRALAAT